MKKNIGTADRVLRFILACIFCMLAIIYKSWILAIVSLFTLYEAIASWCVFYQLIGKNSCPISKQPKDTERDEQRQK